MTRRVYLPPALWALVIVILCGWPGNRLPEITFWQWLRWDKIAHLILFGVQSFLILRAVRLHNYNEPVSHKAIWFTIASVAFYGILVEVLQDTVFLNRSGDVRDALANVIGSVIGLYTFRRIYR